MHKMSDLEFRRDGKEEREGRRGYRQQLGFFYGIEAIKTPKVATNKSGISDHFREI